MNQEKHDVVRAMSDLQTQISALSGGAPKTAVQSAFNTLVLRLAQSNACGPLRVGQELPVAS